MANVIELPNQTQPLIQHFLDQFNQNQRFKQQEQAQAEQDKQTQLYQQGILGVQQGQLGLQQTQYDDKKKEAEAQQYVKRFEDYHDAIDAAQDPQQKAALQQQAQQEADQLKQARPDLIPFIGTAVQQRVMTAQRQAQINAQVNARDRQQVGTTDPYAVAESTKATYGEMPNAPMFQQAQATDLAARQAAHVAAPNISAKIPTPSTNAVSNFEAIATKQMPSAPENQQSQTQLQQTGMQQQGETARTGMQEAGAMAREKLKLNPFGAGGNAPTLQGMVDALATRKASLDDFAKKGTPLREQLIRAMPQGTIAPSNEKERADLVGADNTASLMYDRIQKLRQLSPVVDSFPNRAAIAGMLNASDSTFANILKGTMRNHVDPKVLDYIQELRNLREDQFALRKYLGNSPVRSDKQVGIMLSQSVGTDAGSSADVNRMLDVFEPAVRKLVTGNQSAGDPMQPPDQGVTTTPDGLKWRKNPDGSMTQVP